MGKVLKKLRYLFGDILIRWGFVLAEPGWSNEACQLFAAFVHRLYQDVSNDQAVQNLPPSPSERRNRGSIPQEADGINQ